MLNKIIMYSVMFLTAFGLVSLNASAAPAVATVENIKEMVVDSGDAKLFCRIVGKGKPLIVIHGGPGLSQDYLLPQMYKLAEDNLVIFYDQRASGGSTGAINPETMTVSQFVNDIEVIRKALNLDKVSILGHSWGGFLGMHYSFTYPEQVDKLILSNSLPATSEGYALFEKEFFNRLKPYSEELDKIQKTQAFQEGDPAVMENYYRIIFRTYCYIPEKADLLDLQMTSKEYLDGIKVNGIFNKNELRKCFNLENSLKQLKIPVLIVHGTVDPVPVSTAEAIHHNIPHSKFFLMKNCGHFPYVEEPDTYFRCLTEFLNERGKPPLID